MIEDYDDERKYFCLLLDFFYETQWLYRFPVTELLVRGCLDGFPEEWIPALKALNNKELNELVVHKACKKTWPESLLSFVEKCLHLDTLPSFVVDTVGSDVLPKCFEKGTSEKKRHEILRLANLVRSECEKEGIETVVDLGAGLGYVCQLLNYLYGYRVLGLESNHRNVVTAKQRQLKHYGSSIGRVDYVCAKITANSGAEIRNFLKSSENEAEKDFCLIGLHACGDLGTDACDLFAKIPNARILILVPCCYHKMEILIDDNAVVKRFRNFPVSQMLTNYIETADRDYREFMERPFLRLACQEPAARWNRMTQAAHGEHAFHVLARAVLESYARNNSLTLKKNTRKATRKSQCANFQTYLEDALLRYEFESPAGAGKIAMDASEVREGITRVWMENRERLDEVEIYSGLQLMLQSPAESLVLHDRRCWLLEMGYEAEIVAVARRTLSPRSHAVVSRKRNK